MERHPCVYLLASKPNGTLYLGVTSNLIARIWQHREHAVDGFTAKYDITRLVWYEQHETMESAILREKRLKKWRRAWKVELVDSSNPSWRDLWPDIVGLEPRPAAPSSPHVDTSSPHIDTSSPHIDSTAPHIDSTAPHVDTSSPRTRGSITADQETITSMDSRVRGNDDRDVRGNDDRDVRGNDGAG
ncbi:GIY-YIG nuclease family protein [Lysobacter sp. GX 14042]|uniref:GIY-YIG nuclease family protein n=1 Tax=Lysobacter sp. GX 14042 TaxID=2907155 RepID=UPI0031BADB8A